MMSEENNVFDMSKYLPDLSAVDSITSEAGNVYIVVGNKGTSVIGAACRFEAVEGQLALFVRVLEMPAEGKKPKFKHKESRSYRYHSEPRAVAMLLKEAFPVGKASITPWDLKKEIASTIGKDVSEWVTTLLTEAGCTMKYKSTDDMEKALFAYTDSWPDQEEIKWEPIDATKRATLKA